MTLAAFWLAVAGGVFLGLAIPAFARHKGLGLIAVLSAGVLILIGSMGRSVTVYQVKVNPPHSVSSPSPSSPRATHS